VSSARGRQPTRRATPRCPKRTDQSARRHAGLRPTPPPSRGRISWRVSSTATAPPSKEPPHKFALLCPIASRCCHGCVKNKPGTCPRGRVPTDILRPLIRCCSDTGLERFRGGIMYGVSFVFGASDFRGTRKLGGFRRALRWVGWQTIVLAFVLLDIASLGFTLVAPFWLTPWMTINVVMLVLGALSWSEDRRLRRESVTAGERQAEKVRAMERRNLEERQREAQRQQEAERLRQAEQLRDAERRRGQEEEEREAQRQLEAERLRQAEQLREAERRRRQEEEEREEQRQRQQEREQSTAQPQTEWWIVLEVAPNARKDEIVHKYRRKIQQCHPDRMAGLAPEFLRLAEESTKRLNAAYEHAIRACRQS
jgi:DnaJ-domain-containing protein 1